mgnify:FL=1
MTNVIIRQPGYLPNLGFFKKIQSCDTFVFLDDVQFVKDRFDSRNQILTKNGKVWLTVPLKRPVFKKNLNDILISNENYWNLDHLNLIHDAYCNSRFFEMYWDSIKKILQKRWTKLIDLNMELIDYFISILEIETKTAFSSKLKKSLNQSQRLLDICNHFDASCYISGASGKEYLDEKIFNKSGIEIIYENFQHPVYNQLHKPFVENLSILDLLFNEGDNSKKILEEIKNF